MEHKFGVQFVPLKFQQQRALVVPRLISFEFYFFPFFFRFYFLFFFFIFKATMLLPSSRFVLHDTRARWIAFKDSYI